jgi:predicted regulator of Ras-like GTPase activity (Roadblock/LC7/MglB family)
MPASPPEVTMQAVLSQLNALPGVVGSLVCDVEGRVTCGAFPAVYDAVALQDTARALAGGVSALDLATHGAELLDFRYKDGRLLAKPFDGAVLAVLCTRSTNVQFVSLSLTAAVSKLEKLVRAPAASPAPPPLPAADDAAPPQGAPQPGKRVAPPSSGLDELRRRLAQGGATPPADGRPHRK